MGGTGLSQPLYESKIVVKSSAFWEISERDGSPDAEPEHG